MALILRTPVGPSGGPRHLDTQLDGKPLPGRPPYDLSAPRGWLYGSVLEDQARDYGGSQLDGIKSAGILARGNSEATDFTVCVSGTDGVKFDGGPRPGSLILRRAHIHSLGLKQNDPHADSVQGKGNMTHGLYEDVFHDIPANEGGGRHSNACFIMDSAQGANGPQIVRRNIVRGGNFSIMLDDKGTNQDPGRFTFEDTAFIVEFNSPRFGLLDPEWMSHYTFQGHSAVYYHDVATGVCRFLTNDVADFDTKEWHRATFDGADPATS